MLSFLFINTFMKTFKEIIVEVKLPKDPKKITLDHLGELSPEEKEHKDTKMDLYMDRHGLSGVAAENKVALEILAMRKGK